MSPVSDRQARAGVGGLGVGAIVVGIGTAITGFWLHHHYGPLNSACNSSIGQVGRAVNSEANSMCNNAGTYIWVSYLLIALGVMFVGWGLKHLSIAATWESGTVGPNNPSRPKLPTTLGISGMCSPDGHGIFITRVLANSRASRAGLKPGMRLTAVGDTAVSNPAELEALWQAARSQAKAGEAITARVEQGGVEQEIGLGHGAGESGSQASAVLDLPADDGPCLICGNRLLVPIPMQEHIARAHPEVVRTTL